MNAQNNSNHETMSNLRLRETQGVERKPMFALQHKLRDTKFSNSETSSGSLCVNQDTLLWSNSLISVINAFNKYQVVHKLSQVVDRGGIDVLNEE